MFFHMPMRLYFGSGEIEKIGTIIKNDFKTKNLVLITDKGVVQAELIANVVDKFDNLKILENAHTG